MPVRIDAGSECHAPFSVVSFAGFIDDVRVYDRALDAAEIRSLYEETVE